MTVFDVDIEREDGRKGDSRRLEAADSVAAGAAALATVIDGSVWGVVGTPVEAKPKYVKGDLVMSVDSLVGTIASAPKWDSAASDWLYAVDWPDDYTDTHPEAFLHTEVTIAPEVLE